MNRSQSKCFRRIATAGLTVGLLAGLAAPGAAAVGTGASAGGAERPELQAALQGVVDAGFSGMQLRVHDQRGDWVGSAGVRRLGDDAKPPTDGRFWVGSVTKTFTATVVLQLVAEHKLSLDASVSRYLPRYGFDPRITVRMLLQHTSGLFNYTGEYYDDGTTAPGIPAVGKDWVDNRYRSYRPEQLVRVALSKPARFAPGTGQSYSNTNYTVALLLIEKVTGHSYAAEVQRRILRPLGLRDTAVPGNNPQLPGPHAHGYYRYQDGSEWKVVDVSRQNLSLLAGAGDMRSTTADLQTFIRALMTGKLVPEPLLAQMRTPYGALGYGYGLFVQDLGPSCGGTVYQHNGSPPGGYGALMYSNADGTRTMTASVTSGDAAIVVPTAFSTVLPKLLTAVFCDNA
ncbi:serine hydrolase domain-containing protein [Kribbella sp. NPDC051620]|uniref:serine hydrolase domain-containing protein n=1 Tax=Kribbella sp. NPDC051620 TaxID=3364120 RepID=UPI0037B809BF